MAKGNANPGFNEYGRLQRKLYDKEGTWASSKGWDLARLKRECKKAGINTSSSGYPSSSGNDGIDIFDDPLWNI